MITTIFKLSKELNLPQEVIEKTYRAYWYFIRQKISELPLKEDLTKEEFLKLKKTNFNVPHLGKLYCTYEDYLGAKEHLKHIENAKYKED